MEIAAGEASCSLLWFNKLTQILDSTQNCQALIKFIKRLIKGADRKVFLILDNLRVHHAGVVKAWPEK